MTQGTHTFLSEARVTQDLPVGGAPHSAVGSWMSLETVEKRPGLRTSMFSDVSFIFFFYFR